MTHLLPVDHADGGRRIQLGHGLRRSADDQGLLISGKSRAAGRGQQQKREGRVRDSDDFH